MLAALANGPLTRKDKAIWSAADFLPDRWAAEPAAPPPEPSALDFAASLRNATHGSAPPRRRPR